MRISVAIGLGLAALLLAGASGNPGKGKTQYQQLCSACHGEQGKGDGMAGSAFNPKPFNFTDADQMAKLNDDFLKAAIKDGEYQGTKNGSKYGFMALWMPAFPKLSDGDISGLVSLIRDIQKTKPDAGQLKEVTGRHASAYALFQANCQRCHGENFDGAGPDTRPAGKDGKRVICQPQPPNYRDDAFMGRFSDATLKKIIRNGREGVGSNSSISLMMAIGSSMSDQQLADVVAYLRSLAPRK